MTSRGTAILVAVAVVVGATLAGVLLATQGSGKRARVLQIDEVNGRIGAVVLGETRENVLGALGKPRVVRDGSLGYDHLQVGFRRRLVTSIVTDDPAARTGKVVRMGDPLSAARASYRKAAKCNPNAPDKTAKHPFCSVKVAAGTLLISGDPIRSMTLSRTG